MSGAQPFSPRAVLGLVVAGALSFLQGLLTVVRDSGHGGLLVIIDEVETLQRVLFHDGRSVHARMGSVLLSPSVKPFLHVISIQAQVTRRACPWRIGNSLLVHVPTLLVDPVLSCPELVQLLLDFKLLASIG